MALTDSAYGLSGLVGPFGWSALQHVNVAARVRANNCDDIKVAGRHCRAARLTF